MSEGPYLNLRLKAADILRLQPNDIVMLHISRPLASSELEKLIGAWKSLMREHGFDSVDLVVVSGVDSQVEVVRKPE